MKTSLAPTEIEIMATLADAADKLHRIPGGREIAEQVRRILCSYVQDATSSTLEE